MTLGVLLAFFLAALRCCAAACEWGQRSSESAIGARPHTASIVDFGAIGDGRTLNTQAFQNAVFYLSSFASIGGAKLYVPPGRWLTGSFNLTSHFTLYLEQGATILGSQDPSDWPVIDPLPSYGRGRELPGARHISLIHGQNLQDVVITGENGTIDGQGAIWWQWSKYGHLNYTRGHLVEFVNSSNVIICNVTLVDSPFWNIHPVYCNKVLIQGVTILAPQDSPNTDGIDPDSSSNVCIRDCYISNGDDMIAIKSGWDEYGIAYGMPSSNIDIRRVFGRTLRGAAIAIGSETSGGIENVLVEDMVAVDTKSGISIRTGAGRGAYVRNILFLNMRFINIQTAITISGFSSEHPDQNYNRTAFPKVEKVVVRGLTGNTLNRPGRILGIPQVPFRDICLTDISLDISAGLAAWKCEAVEGYSSQVRPQLCSQLASDLDSASSQSEICSLEQKGPGSSPPAVSSSNLNGAVGSLVTETARQVCKLVNQMIWRH